MHDDLPVGLLELAARVDGGEPIDWDAEERAADDDQARAVIQGFRVLAGVAAVAQDDGIEALGSPPPWPIADVNLSGRAWGPLRLEILPATESAGRAWHIAYTSPNVSGIQAAVSVGLGVSILPEVAILPEHRVLKKSDGFPSITNTEVALVAVADASPATRRLAEVLAEFCSALDSHRRRKGRNRFGSF